VENRMSFFSGWPWWAQLIGLVVLVLIAVFLFQNIVMPLIQTIT
jgi:hypothetical protein